MDRPNIKQANVKPNTKSTQQQLSKQPQCKMLCRY